MARTDADAVSPQAADRWWVVEGATFTGHVLQQAPTGRAARAACRKAIIDADRANGMSRRDAQDWVRAAALRVTAGPWTREQAIEFEIGMRWAWKICDTVFGDRSEPAGPARRDEAVRHLGSDETERIDRFVRSVYVPGNGTADLGDYRREGAEERLHPMHPQPKADATAPNLALLADLVAAAQQIAPAISRTELTTELQASSRPDALRVTLAGLDYLRMLLFDHVHVAAQATADTEPDISLMLTDVVAQLGYAGRGLHEVLSRLAEIERELPGSDRTPQRPPRPPVSDEPPGRLAGHHHVDTLRKVVAGHPIGTVKVTPAVARDLIELAGAEPDGLAPRLVALCAEWQTDDWGALVPAPELAKILTAEPASEGSTP